MDGAIKLLIFQVPVPVTDGRAQHMAMKWLIQAASDKPSEQRFYDVLAKELVAASQNQVYVLTS